MKALPAQPSLYQINTRERAQPVLKVAEIEFMDAAVFAQGSQGRRFDAQLQLPQVHANFIADCQAVRVYGRNRGDDVSAVEPMVFLYAVPLDAPCPIRAFYLS